MSRCFPFPPPGYEKKARSDEADLLKKEKQREKKPKKEKKDKEKGESKEKKEKDRSDEKHREKKEKKEKHRDKKEKKDGEKDKDKSSNPDEKRFPGNSEGPDGGKSSKEKKFPGKYDTHSEEKVIQKEKEKDKDRNSMSGKKKFAGQFSGYSGEKPSQNIYRAGNVKDSKVMQDAGRRIRDEDRETGNQLVEKFSGRDTKRDEGMVRLVAKATGTLDEGKEKKKDKKGVDRKLDVQSVKDKARFSGNTVVQNPAGMVQTRVEGMLRPLEKDVQSKTLGKEKTKEKEGDDKRGDKRKDKNREKKSQGKDKEKKKEEKAKMKSEHKNSEKDTLKGSNKDELIGIHNKKTLQPLVGSGKGMIEQNVRKRKDNETNGFVHVNEVKPNKLPRLTSLSQPLMENNKWPEVTSSSHPLTGNGRILDHCQTSTLCTADRQGAADSIKANGIIASQALSVSAAEPTTAQTDQITEVSSKPPHPDSKYLSQVLAVPKMEEWLDFDDQEWLFHNADSQSKKHNVGCSGEDDIPQVWAEAMPIESADVCALPYVIPY
ncbi:hypothetical protein Ddye_019225 [Dipteronia dyeriana]|uniref:Myb-like protein X n=1 Tax=Dipteronia dyeriana TaxID=168575 RepID=A0AAD9TXG5_9ROSI|nr:hypothetical protein Ddye_019225 [Dipteronia dyeriana]